MADVTLVIDNADRLLPVDYGEVEIGRRLYRSGESEYLLNRQRIRLRDLVELLDAGNLADNAFLFIGQGMVDQALALRPEERRPLFEEAAGVRRHERRRRQAEAELVEAEANLERVRDVLAELRPQAKRLAAQAEQLQARRTAGLELAEGLLAAAQARWLSSSNSATQQAKALDRARTAADAALAELKSAEEQAATLSQAIARRADDERNQRGEAGHQQRGAEGAGGRARRGGKWWPPPGRGGGGRPGRRRGHRLFVGAAFGPGRSWARAGGEGGSGGRLVERQLAELEPTAPMSDAAAQLRARSAELEQHVRRRESISASEAGASVRVEEFATRLSAAERERDEAAVAVRAAHAALSTTEETSASARRTVDDAAAARSNAQDRLAATEAELAAARARLAAAEASISAGDEGLARAARARGGTLLGEGLEVEPELRRAVSAALGVAGNAYLVDEGSVQPLAERRGTLVVRGTRSKAATGTAVAELVGAAKNAGGGALADAVRRDPQGEVTRLLARVVWLPDLGAALAIRNRLPSSWRAVTVAGEVVDDRGVVELGSGASSVDLQAERSAARLDLDDVAARLASDRSTFERQRNAATAAQDAAAGAARDFEAARQEARRTEEKERIAQRRAEQLLRELTWERSQAQRLTGDVSATDALVTQLMREVDRLRAEAEGLAKADGAEDRTVRRLQLVGRRDDLRRKRDQRAAELRASEETRRRAEIARSIDESRARELEADGHASAQRLGELADERARQTSDLGAAQERLTAASAALDALLAAGSHERERLGAAERSAVVARERLREAENASRAAEMHAMEARLQLEQTREQLLVELATIGDDARRCCASWPMPKRKRPKSRSRRSSTRSSHAGRRETAWTPAKVLARASSPRSVAASTTLARATRLRSRSMRRCATGLRHSRPSAPTWSWPSPTPASSSRRSAR